MYRALALITVFGLTACNTHTTPDCPYTDDQRTARSAGCFSVVDERLLLVQGLSGTISIPGGGSEPRESAQCTAFRETWEETGLKLQPRELIQVFDTGFYLYRCERHEHSGEIDPPTRLEVRSAFYLSLDDFEKYRWRYPKQQTKVKKLLREYLPE